MIEKGKYDFQNFPRAKLDICLIYAKMRMSLFKFPQLTECSKIKECHQVVPRKGTIKASTFR
jgi:hypothetical protein